MPSRCRRVGPHALGTQCAPSSASSVAGTPTWPMELTNSPPERQSPLAGSEGTPLTCLVTRLCALPHEEGGPDRAAVAGTWSNWGCSLCQVTAGTSEMLSRACAARGRDILRFVWNPGPQSTAVMADQDTSSGTPRRASTAATRRVSGWRSRACTRRQSDRPVAASTIAPSDLNWPWPGSSHLD